MLEREKMYFEPRCVSVEGNLRWYGKYYRDEKLLYHLEKTVYIRDSGEYLFVYEMREDLQSEERVHADFKLICKILKTDTNRIYGRRIS